MSVRTVLGISLVASLGACDVDAGSPREVGPMERAADAGDGLQILATLDLEGPATRAGGGLWVALRDADGDVPTLVHLVVIDPADSKIDVYADVRHELHALSDPLSDDQIGALTAAAESGQLLHIVSDAGITAPTGIAMVRFALIEPGTDEIVPAGEMPFRLVQG